MGTTDPAEYSEELATVLNYIKYGSSQTSYTNQQAARMLNSWFSIQVGNDRLTGKLIIFGWIGQSPDMCGALQLTGYGSGLKYLCFRVPYTRKYFEYHFANKLKDNFYYM